MGEVRLEQMEATAEQRALRNELLRDLMDNGISRTDANITLDMAKHAVHEAQKTIARVANTAEPRLRAYILALAMQQMALVCKFGMSELLRRLGG